MTAAVSAGTAARQLSAEALAVMGKFPPRPVPAAWDATAAGRFTIVRRMLAPPFPVDGAQARQRRKLALLKTLDWLELHPGTTWQERWDAAGAGTGGGTDWRDRMLADLRAAGELGHQGERHRNVLGLGLLQLIGGDVLRPGLPWLLATRSPGRIAPEMARVRDPGGLAALKTLRDAGTAGDATFAPALERVALIMAAKGGLVSDITPGDCIELLDCCSRLFTAGRQQAWRHSPFFYQLLHSAGVFPGSAPATVWMISTRFAGQLTVEQLVDRYGLSCRPVRDLLVDYLRERQPGIDYSTLKGLATTLALLFWKDLETHHPGIDSLKLPPDIAAGWKQRAQTRTARTPGGGQSVARESADNILVTVRAFYHDLGQWALDEPARWGPWAVPCPVRGSDIQYGKQKSRVKARMDQRTRERLPVLPALAAAVDRERKDAAARLDAARAASPGELFSAGGQTLRRARLTRSSRKIWAEAPDSGKRRNLALEEENAFWAWAAVEVLRHTGVRIEELTELSHHSLVQYRLPSGELVPLLSVAPSKTDQERLLVIDPELADVLSAVITRVRGSAGAVPAVAAYDTRERTWNPPMPLLSQRVIGLENRPVSGDRIRDLLHGALTSSGITGSDGKPLDFLPHDFRRVFTTDAILNGMPPHIAQLILGHKDINTTMGYKAVYPEEAIRSHRAFIARRRELRPSEEYRSPSDSEWEEFLGHFERRRVALGDCGRAYGTSCIHEHSCVRCPLLRISPAQRGRLEDIRDNLLARIAEAEREGWVGEAEGLKVSLAAANNKLAQADATSARRSETVGLGIPSYRDIAAATITAPGDRHDR